MDMKMDVYQTKWMQPELQLVDERELIEDREYLCSLYPAKARILEAMIEDACDRLEYEGSPMLVTFLDKETIFKMVDDLYGFVASDEETEDGTLKCLICVMLCNEFAVRRGRYKRRRKFF